MLGSATAIHVDRTQLKQSGHCSFPQYQSSVPLSASLAYKQEYTRCLLLVFHQSLFDCLNQRPDCAARYPQAKPRTNPSRTAAIEGLFLYLPKDSDEHSFNTEAFKKMRHLKFLVLNYVKLTGSYKHFSKELRLLSWFGFPLEAIPADFDLRNLVHMDLRYSKLVRVWEDSDLSWITHGIRGIFLYGNDVPYWFTYVGNEEVELSNLKCRKWLIVGLAVCIVYSSDHSDSTHFLCIRLVNVTQRIDFFHFSNGGQRNCFP
ncbi:hypothetical protein DVH24_031713 [Malus domestica]|uniref:Uncharacterized protein n=1 Tax=Malus domestica TaxID=3750 RepID=A0A498J2F5_MALDO|nr:hypothetical protein DVH24_031713 [Malus domestica]